MPDPTIYGWLDDNAANYKKQYEDEISGKKSQPKKQVEQPTAVFSKERKNEPVASYDVDLNIINEKFK